MAGNADVNSTADDDLLLYDIRALVAQRCKSTPEAERLIIEFTQNGHFTECRYRGDYIPLRHWGAWYPKFGLWISVDFDNSTVTYLREAPPSETVKLVLEDVWEELKKLAREERPLRLRFKNGSVLELAPPPIPPPPFLRMILVRLHRDEVLSMLRRAGLLGPSEQLPTLEPSTSPESPPAPQQAAAGGQSKSPEAPSPKEPQTLEKWLPWAETRWPKEKQAVDDYDEFLLSKAPKRWKKHSLQTTRSNLKKQAKQRR